jgi:ribosome biogenesis GTPase
MSAANDTASARAGLAGLGWNRFFEQAFVALGAEGLTPARVVREEKERYLVCGESGEMAAEVPGRFRHEAMDESDFPAVGDWVAVRALGPERALIVRVLPRRSSISRKVAWTRTSEQVIAANVDTVLLVAGLDQEFNPRRIERYVVAMRRSGAAPVIVLNKTNLCPDLAARIAELRSVAAGIPVHPVSALEEDGLDALHEYLRDAETIAFIGSSGVGKSTIINRLLGTEHLRTGAVSVAMGKGKHITTRRELIPLPAGGLLIDTPGMRELQLWGDEADVNRAFEDIEELTAGCRFRDCRHQDEPGCAVRAALELGDLAAERFESFRKLQREAAFLARRQRIAELKVKRVKRRVAQDD